MQNDTDELVFIRKRKRLRAFVARETEPVVSPKPVGDTQLHAGLIPEIAALPEPLTPTPASLDHPKPPSQEASSENMITVESFLRCAVIKQASPGSVSPRKSRAYTHRRPAERGTTRAQKVTKASKRRRESSRIANALFRAVVLTDGDPLDALAEDAGISHARRPLKFVPFNKFAAPIESGQTKSTEPPHLGRREDLVLHTRRHGHTSHPKPQHHISHARVPLYLVPLQEAETAYSVMFR